MKLSTITLAAIKAEDLPGGIPSPNAEDGTPFGVLKQMALLSHEDSGFSFVTTLDYLNSWLKDAATDADDGLVISQAYPFIQELAAALRDAKLPAILVSLDADFDQAIKP